MEKRIFVGIDCIFEGTKKYRDKVMDAMRSAYDKGDNLNEKDFLNRLNWYKEYTKICNPNRDSLKALRLYREFVVVSKHLCIAEREAYIRMLIDFGYPYDMYSISVKSKGHDILDSSKPELHYGDILTKGFTITGNVLVDKNIDELRSWTVRGGQSLFFDSMAEENDYQAGDEYSIIYTVNKLTKLPKLVGTSKK